MPPLATVGTSVASSGISFESSLQLNKCPAQNIDRSVSIDSCPRSGLRLSGTFAASTRRTPGTVQALTRSIIEAEALPPCEQPDVRAAAAATAAQSALARASPARVTRVPLDL